MNYYERYRASHRHPINRAFHSVGIPAIIVALPMLLVNWRIALGLWVGGWICQFVGHAVEGTMPSFFRNPVYLLVGPVWWCRKLFRSEKLRES